MRQSLHYFGITILSLFIFYSCQKDDEEKHTETSNEIQNIISKKVSISEITNSQEVSNLVLNILTKQ